jgi:hypothetical protein
LKKGIFEEGMSNYNELQNNISDDADTQNSPFRLFISPKHIFSIFPTDTNNPILNHVRPAFPFRRGNIGVGSQ